MKNRLLSVFALFLGFSFVSCDKSEVAQTAQPVANAPEIRAVFVEGEGDGLTMRVGNETRTLDASVPVSAGATIASTKRARLRVGPTTVVLGEDSAVEVYDTAFELKILKGEVLVEGEGAEPLVIHTPHADFRAEFSKANFLVRDDETLVSVARGELGVTHGGQTQLAFAGQEVSVRSGASSILWSSQIGENVGWSELVRPSEERVYTSLPRGLGKLVGRPPLSSNERELDMVGHDVNVRIAGNVAYTEVHESFKNPTGESLEGLYRFPLPPDAQISRLALKVGSTWMEGEFLETARAERIWRDIITPRRDPAILKWKQGNQFELRIFPILPGQIREVKIGYTQELKPAAEGYRYVYPMATEEAAGVLTKKFGFEAKLLGVDASAALEVSGYPAEVRRGASESDQAAAIVSYDAKDFRPSGDFVIRYSGGADSQALRSDFGAIRTWSFTSDKTPKSEPSTFVLSAIRPVFETPGTRSSRDFVIVADTSYSRRGLVAELQAELVQKLVEEMDPRDRVSAMACAVRCVPLSAAEFTLASSARALALGEALEKTEAAGTYNALEGIEVASRLFAARSGEDSKRETHVIVLTDGQVSAGWLNPSKIKSEASSLLQSVNARVSVVDFGGDSDALVLEAIASAGKGSVIALDPMLPRASQALNILSLHYGQVLRDVEISLPEGLQMQTATQKGALLSGDEWVVASRTTEPGLEGVVEIRGTLGDKPWKGTFPLKVEPSSKFGFVPRAWASHRISQLELGEEDARSEIIRTSIRYGVLSRYTALLALEDKAMMDEFGVKARKRDDWRGEEVEAEVSEGDMVADSGAKDAEAPKAAPATRGRSMAPQKSMSLDSLGGAEMDFKEPPMERRSARRMPMYPVRVPVVEHTVTERVSERLVDSAKRRLDTLRKRLDREPENRTYMMRYIRGLVRAHEHEQAKEWTEKWLTTNSSDPEALVQKAQLLSHEGRFDEAMMHLASAADSAARGSWIQERIHKAYASIGEAALACQHEISWAEARNKAFEKKCELASDTTLFGLSQASLSAETTTVNLKRGQIEIELEWEGSVRHHILLVEPDGRTLSAFSQRRGLMVSHEGGREKLVLPSSYAGQFQVRVVSETGEGRARLSIKAGGIGRTYDVNSSRGDGWAAQIDHTVGYRTQPRPFR